LLDHRHAQRVVGARGLPAAEALDEREGLLAHLLRERGWVSGELRRDLLRVLYEHGGRARPAVSLSPSIANRHSFLTPRQYPTSLPRFAPCLGGARRCGPALGGRRCVAVAASGASGASPLASDDGAVGGAACAVSVGGAAAGTALTDAEPDGDGAGVVD